MSSKISQHYIEKKHLRTPWVKKIFLIYFFECWKFPTSNPFKPKHSHGPCKSHTHSLGSQIISSHMSSKISQHYIEKKHLRTPWVKKIFLIYIFLSVGSSQLQTLSNQSTHIGLAGLIHIAWGLRSYLPTCAQRSANTT